MSALSYAAGAGADSLREAIKQARIEQLQRHAMKMAEQKLAEDARQADMRNVVDQGQLDLGGKRLGLDTDRHGLDVRQYDEGAPQRTATLRYTGAQADELVRRPEKEAADRGHDEFMAGLGNKFRLGEIGARGAEDRRTQNARLVATPKPGAAATGAYAEERSTRILDSVNDLEKQVSSWTTGAGSLLANLPATDARNFDAQLNTLKANIAFGELKEMRDASKTGGALGQVSDRELTLLSSALGALDSGQSPENFKKQLQQIRDSITRWNQAKASAGGAAAPTATTPGGAEYDYVPGKGLVPKGGK